VQKILLVTNDFGPRAGGIETFIIGLLERIPKGEVLVYTSEQDGHEEYDQGWQRDFGVEVIRDRTKILLPTPRVIRSLRKLISSRDIEVIWFGAAAPLGLSARWLRTSSVRKIVALTHGHEVWWAKLPPFSFLMREIAKGVDHFGYLAEYTANELSRVIPQRKLTKIAPGIDVNHFIPHQVEKKHRAIISVGRLVHRKGQDKLVEALPLIKREIPEVELIFVGEGPHRKELDRLVKKHQLQSSVRFIGRVNYKELPRYFSLGDIFAMPSRTRLFGLEVEGLGIVYLEASACGLAVIGGDSGGAPDAVLDGETGFVVDGNSVQDIAERAIELLRNEDLRKKMGERGRSWVEEEWNWDVWSDRFNALLR
jgi:phosphatidylinositol alpha-1,6-mannosyltransferase